MNNNVRKLTEGAMMVAIIGMFLFLNRQTAGMLEIYMVWLMPLPMVMYSTRYGWKNAMIAFVSVIFLSFIISLPQTLFYLVSTTLCGLVYGEMVRRKSKNLNLLFVTMAFTIIANLVTTVLFGAFFGYDINAEAVQMAEMVRQFFAGLNVKLAVDLPFLIRNVVPMIAIATGVMEAFIVHLLSNFLLKRMKVDVVPPKPLSQIQYPRWVGYLTFPLFLLSQLCLYYQPPIPTLAYQLVMNLGLASTFILIGFGFLAVLIFGAFRNMKYLVFVVIILFTFAFMVAGPALAVIGFLFLSTNMRSYFFRR